MSSQHPQNTTDLTSPALLDVIANRRSYYTLNGKSPIPDSQIQSILTSILQTVPSAFNMQSTRLVLAVGPAHHKVWDITTHLLRTHMGEERWAKAPTGGKLAGFRAGHGTVLFYEDTTVVGQMKEKFANYRDKFDEWSEHGSGMHQLAVWCALEAEGLGANLQHYNGVIDADVAKEFQVPDGWHLKAQMVFGGVEGGKRPDPKDKLSPEQTLKVFGL